MAVARVEMLVHKPVTEVFRAFVDPVWLTQFWLARSSGPLELGQSVEWEFMVPGAKVTTYVKAIEKDTRIAVDWSDGTSVEWRFEPRDDGATRVSIDHGGFQGTSEKIAATAIEATQGFSIVLCDLKVLLETGSSPHLVRDKARLIREVSAE